MARWNTRGRDRYARYYVFFVLVSKLWYAVETKIVSHGFHIISWYNQLKYVKCSIECATPITLRNTQQLMKQK